MNDNPKISVIMSVYNDENYLKESIESILNQEFKDFEFIIVNDKSTDNSLKIINKFHDKRILIINNKKNLGLTKSLNIALKLAKGKYIARQDADDISLPQRFKKQYSFLEKNPEIALLGTSIYRIDENSNELETVLSFEQPSFKHMLNWNHFKHGSVLFRKVLVNEIGGYNELFEYVQDYEFWLRISKRYKVRNLKDPLYKLRIHNASIGSKKVVESRLYGRLARKVVNNEITNDELENIRLNGIFDLCPILTNIEIKEIKMEIYNIKSGIYIKEGEMKLAREEYKKIFCLDPYNLINLINIVRSYFGIYLYKKSSTFLNYYYHIFKKFRN